MTFSEQAEKSCDGLLGIDRNNGQLCHLLVAAASILFQLIKGCASLFYVRKILTRLMLDEGTHSLVTGGGEIDVIDSLMWIDSKLFTKIQTKRPLVLPPRLLSCVRQTLKCFL